MVRDDALSQQGDPEEVGPERARRERNLRFSSRAWAEYLAVHAEDGKLFDKLNTLIEGCRRHSLKGTGKPEPLGGNLAGWWSRRIGWEQRLAYRVPGSGDEQMVQVAQCRCRY